MQPLPETPRTPESTPVSSPGDITPVHVRTSRRLQGLQPEHGLLPTPSRTMNVDPQSSAAAVAAAHQVIVNQPQTPIVFHGDPSEDVEDWLDHFDRVAECNGWNAERKLRYVYFALQGSAKTWFHNHEAALTSWDEFRRQLTAAFSSADRKERAELAIQSRFQAPNESVTTYTEDMARLFRRADASMAEDQKVRHLMRGVKQEIFAGLIRNPPATLTDFLAEATTMERALRQRARQYNRNVMEFSSGPFQMTMGNNTDDLREFIRAVIREELQKIQGTDAATTRISVAEMVRDEVRQAVQPPCYDVPQHYEVPQHYDAPQCYEVPQQQEPIRVTYAEAARRPALYAASNVVRPFVRTEPPFRRRSPPYVEASRPRKSDIWRAPDFRPLCYHCGEAGHIYRMCPYRRVGLRGFAPNAPRPRPGERPSEIENFIASRDNSFDQRRHEPRSASPARYRSPSPVFPRDTRRHRSPSPANPGN